MQRLRVAWLLCQAAALLSHLIAVAGDVVCSDPRATNFNGSVNNEVDLELNGRICTYPLVRRTVNQWASLYVNAENSCSGGKSRYC
jgi:hypothetical protein